MESKVVDKYVPISFEKVSEYETKDTRFLKVTIWLMHMGVNYNNSYFEKSAVIKAIPTLANTPILAYIEENSNGDLDFSDHRMTLVVKDGETNIKYLGQAIGTIPENNNARFEMKMCDDGIEREFLVVDGLVWTKFDDPVDIFESKVSTAQSMELHDDYSGYWGKDGYFYFSDFKFYGTCALGTGVQPAMESSTIEVNFSEQNVFSVINKKVEEYKAIFSSQQEGGLDLMEETQVTQEEVVETKDTQFEQTEETTETVEKVEATEEVETVQEETQENFEADETEQVEETEVTEEAQVEEEIDETDYKSEYEKIKSELEGVHQEFSALKEELEGLRTFKADTLKAERETQEAEMYARFANELTEEEISSVKESAAEFTLDQLEEKLFTLVGKKKATFSAQPKKEVKAIKVELERESEEYNPYGSIFSKYQK